MLERLQKKWKVTGLQLVLILCTFAIGGSLTGYAARKLMPFIDPGSRWAWILLYIILITLIWPIAVLVISIFFGQFRFFTAYLKKIGRRFHMISAKGKEYISDQPVSTTKNQTVNIAIFASGAGSNAFRLLEYFKNSSAIRVSLVACNKPGAGVIDIASQFQVPVLMMKKDRFFNDGYVRELRNNKIDFIVLAGFLWKLPPALVEIYRGRIMNIHPALLPAYGGKGMHGQHVHQAVIGAGEKESGISIHYVDELYDHGQIIFQAKCDVQPGDTPDSLAARIHTLEHQHYARVVEETIKKTMGA